jgi:nucleotide-binding universal stress UspA family protein
LRASCPIAVIRNPGGIEHGEIAVGVRTVDGARAALRFAFEEAALRKAHLTVVHAVDENTSWLGHLAENMASWQCQFPQVAVRYNQIDGHPGRILAAYSNFTDLVVVGRHNGSSHNLGHGSAVQALLNHAQAPVLIVPSD